MTDTDNSSTSSSDSDKVPKQQTQTSLLSFVQRKRSYSGDKEKEDQTLHDEDEDGDGDGDGDEYEATRIEYDRIAREHNSANDMPIDNVNNHYDEEELKRKECEALDSLIAVKETQLVELKKSCRSTSFNQVKKSL